MVSLSFGLTNIVVAQTDPNPGDTFGLSQINKTVKLAGGDIRETAARIINIGLGLLGIIMVGLILYAGFLYMTAVGNDEQITTAKKYITNAIIGLVIILSAFAIVQFVFKSLGDAIVGDQSGDNGDDDNDLPLDVCDPNSSNYNAEQCTAFCVAHPEYDVCKNLVFYVMGITPGNVDSKNELTAMNNIRIRVLFSHALAADINLAKSIILTAEGGADPLPLSVAILENNRVLEAVYAPNGSATSFLVGSYTVTVNSSLKDTTGKVLQPYSVGGVNYSTTASFNVSAAVEDKTKPIISSLTLNGSGGSDLAFSINENLTIAGTLNDRATVLFGGNGLIKLTIADDVGAITATDYAMPLVAKGSINSFVFNYTTKLDNKFVAGKKYTVTITGYDIDSNVATASITFKTKAAHCNNDVQDGDETGLNTGGSCGGGQGDSCKETSDCASGFACVGNICTAVPMISQVDPMNGAEGNWITVLGKHFGTKTGLVEFATDFNKNEKYDADEWIKAEIVSCNNAPSWNPDWAVVQVPKKGEFIINNTAAQFNGVDGHVEASVERIDSNKGLTFEAWVKPTDSGAHKTIISKIDVPNKEGYFLALNNLQPAVWLSGLSTPGWHLATGKVPLNEWSHLVATYDGASIKFYINGTLNTTKNISGLLLGMPGKVWIGMREDFNTKINQFKGGMDEVALYNKVLTAAQITDHYTEAQKIGGGIYDTLVNEAEPLGYWRLGENSGTAVLDSGVKKADGVKADGVYVGGITLNQIGIFGSSIKKSGIGEKSAIRITVSSTSVGKTVDLFDLTVDDFGPKPNGDGLFILNTTKRPGLCRVGVTNDTEVELGGTKVTLLSGNQAAPSKVAVTAHGSGFGSLDSASKLFFGAQKNPITGILTGGFQGEVKTNTDWTDLAVNTKVPENLQSGDLAVHVVAGGEASNGVKFKILSAKTAMAIPLINSIDPSTTTPKSFITISGNGFGATIGQVFVADSEQHTQSCGTAIPHASCSSLNVDNLPNQCGVTWSNTQVIAEIPTGLSAGLYYVSLKNNTNFRTDGKNTITIKTGPPLAGICRIEPAKGPAPLPASSEGMNIYGVNFPDEPILYFWQLGAEIDKPDTWLHSDKDMLNGGSVIKKAVATQITTLLPVSSKGTSLSTGPIKIKNPDGSFTNSYNYTVESCIGAKDFPGYHCCAKGPETGMWKQNSQSCSGEAREAGYVWRFTTGIIADLPRVVEECNEQVFPSPTPRKQTTSTPKIDACVNSTVALRFNMGMNNASLNSDTVKVFACGSSTASSTLGQIDCAKTKDPVKDLEIDYQTGANTLIIRQVPPASALTPNTWYQVELSNKIKSQQVSKILGVDQTVSSTLSITKPCGAGTAFCFTFKTGSKECTLVGAGINPPQYTARQLGIIQDPRYPFDSSALFLYPNLPSAPYYYFIWGKGSQECSVINVDQYPWEWSTNAITKANVFKSPLGTKYVNSRAVAQALAHTAPQSVEIKAEIDINSVSEMEGTDILQLAGIDPGTQGYQINDKIILSSSVSDLLSFQSSFTLQLKFSQPNPYPYTNLLEKRNPNSPKYGYKIITELNFNSLPQICVLTYSGANAQTQSKDCFSKFKADKNGIFNVLLSWNKGKGELSLINLAGLITEEIHTLNSFPISTSPASLVSFKLPSASLGPTLYQFVYKNEPADLKIINGGLHFAPTSTLTIDLSDPVVTYFEPNCVESCVNATIRADFNRVMDPATFVAGFKVYKCTDGAECKNNSEVANYAVDSDASSYLSLRTTLKNNLTPNTYYKVTLSNDGQNGTIKSIAQILPTIVQGKALPKTEWVFKTKNDGKPCGVSSLKVSPIEFVATQVGQKDKFTVTPYSAPNACSKIGQALNKWDYSYIWKTVNEQGVLDEKVAKISDIKPASYINISYSCTNSCVKKGSTIPASDPKFNGPLCGDGTVQNGEDCDLGIAGEIPNVSCSLNCLRPGTTTVYSVIAKKTGNNLCGNGTIETGIGELCDPGHTTAGEIKIDDPYCATNCLLLGSSEKITGKVGVAVCGDGEVTIGQESCDIAIGPITKKPLCSASCLHLGTQLSADWCQKNTDYKSDIACVTSVSVCGNEKLEPSEDCEPSSSAQGVCTNKCLFDNACGLNPKPCNKNTPGCSDKCTLLGSKTTYNPPSICGDGLSANGTAGIGEDKSCELATATTTANAGPTQLVQAVGLGDVVAGKTYQETKVQVSTGLGQNKVNATSTYQLQCGYTEYIVPIINNDKKQFNDCPLNNNNIYGVDGGSCCLARPRLKSGGEYPQDGAGFAGTPGICRNTYIEAEFDQELRPETLANNIFLVRGHTESNFDCVGTTSTVVIGGVTTTVNSMDATEFVNNILEVSKAKPLTFWARVWQKITNVFKFLTGSSANATAMKNAQEVTSIAVWCAGEVPVTITTRKIQVDNKTVTAASIGIGSLLDENSVYGILLRGDVGGIVNVRGVPLGSSAVQSRNDAWFFQTGAEVCKIKSISVAPKSEFFGKPNASSTFFATTISNSDQQIVPTPGYSWVWAWGPKNPVFDIPYKVDSPSTTDTIIIGAKNVQGHITGIAQATVTADTSEQNNQLNKVFTDTFELDALFCENPWPSPTAPSQYPYTDNQYNFKMSYCADAGKTNNIGDDLPYLSPELSLVGVPSSTGSLKKVVFFTDSQENTDAIGLQIFSSSVPLKQWYAEKFGGSLGNMKDITIGNYSALTDGNNYYIQALNYVSDPDSPAKDVVDSNVYLLGINPNAANVTKEVFKKLLSSLEFNINLTDHGYCLAAGNDIDVRLTPNQLSTETISTCSTDFDCRDSNGIAKFGTNGTCSNAKTKFLRDWGRLADIKLAQERIDGYFDGHSGDFDFKGSLAAGSFVPGYTVSHWGTSWKLLNTLVGGLPIDPIDKWTSCAANDQQTCWDAASTTYHCPNFSSVYEYEYVSSTKDYLLHSPLEFFTVNDLVTQEIIPNLDRFTTDRWAGCAFGGSYNPFSEQCGDGVLNGNEQCEPPGKIELTTQGVATAGQCANWATRPSCGDNASCGYYIKSSQSPKYPIHTFHQIKKTGNGVCAMVKGSTFLLAENIPDLAAKNEYTLYSCSTNDDCRNFSTYSSSANMSVFTINFDDHQINLIADTVTMPVLHSDAINFQDYMKTKTDILTCIPDLDKKVVVESDICEGLGQTTCLVGKKAPRTCSNQCVWQYGACGATTKCGNGIVEVAEACDDGALNGTYGHCNKDNSPIKGCTGLSAAGYCGNTKIDFKDENGNGTKDAAEKSYEFCDPSVVGTNFKKNYDILKANSCSWDCQGYGAYCGDGIIQNDNGEQCDDGNTKDNDFCSATCKFTALACKKDVFGVVSALNDGNNNQETEITVKKDGIIPTSCVGVTMAQLCSAYGLSPCLNFKNYFGGGVVSTAGCPNYKDIFISDSILSNVTAPNASVFCTGLVSSTAKIDPGVCGNGMIDVPQGEICDGGAKNDIVCVPEPGKNSCTYCAKKCTQILTVDTSAFCGNGKIDLELNEVCEIANDGSILRAITIHECSGKKIDCYDSCVANPNVNLAACKFQCDKASNLCVTDAESGASVPAICPEKGTYQCTNNCQTISTFETSCASCGIKTNAPTPYAQFINPILWSWSELPTNYGNAYFYKKNKLLDGSLYEKAIGGRSFITPTLNSVPFSSDLNNINGSNNIKIETNQLCSQDYGVMFNSDKVNTSDTNTAIDILPNTNKVADFFPYSVNGESGATIFREFIMSPAVPPQTFRVVLKWTDAEKDAEFNAAVFNEEYTTKISSEDKLENVVDYLESAYFSGLYLCSIMSKQQKSGVDYWLPSSSTVFISTIGGYQKCSNDGGVQVSPKINTPKTYVQAFTIDTTGYDKPYAFFIGALDKFIGDYKKSNLEVQIYTYHDGQKPLYSIYGPTFTYTIKKADVGTNPVSRYWHVFNLIKNTAGKYEVKPIQKLDAAKNVVGEYSDGMLQSSFCKTLNHLPGSECVGD